MKLKILIGILVFLILVNLATIGTFVYMRFTHQRPPEFFGGRGEGPPPGPPFIGDLNEDQRERMHQLMEGFRSATSEKRKQLDELDRSLFSLLQQNPVNHDSLEARLKQVDGLRLDISRAAMENLIKAKEFLTPVQQEHFFHMIMQSRPAFPGRRPPMRGERPPPDRTDHDDHP